MSRVAWRAFASWSRKTARWGEASAGWLTRNRTSVRFRSGFSRFPTISSSISRPHAPQDVVHPPSRGRVDPDAHGALAGLPVCNDRTVGCEGDAHQGKEVLLAPYFESHALPRLKGFGDDGPHLLSDHAGGVVEDDHPVADALELRVPSGLLDPLCLEVDDRDLREDAPLDEIRGRVVPDGDEGLCTLHRTDDLCAAGEAADRAGELRPHRLR